MLDERYLDDFDAGEVFDCGGYTLTEAAIVDFGLSYDPQPFHIDAQAAARSPYGGLIASGFQTMAICFRLVVQRGMFSACSIGSPGMDEVRWFAPVRPHDTLYARAEVLEVRPSRSKPDRGILRMRYSGINQRGETVLSYISNHLLSRRP